MGRGTVKETLSSFAKGKPGAATPQPGPPLTSRVLEILLPFTPPLQFASSSRRLTIWIGQGLFPKERPLRDEPRMARVLATLRCQASRDYRFSPPVTVAGSRGRMPLPFREAGGERRCRQGNWSRQAVRLRCHRVRSNSRDRWMPRLCKWTRSRTGT